MNLKKWITLLLLAFVGVSFALLAVQESKGGSRTANADPPAGRTEPDAGIAEGPDGAKIIAYYFHATKRCETCLKIQRQADAVIRRDFAEELGSGDLTWQVVNIDDPANSHFVTDFELTHQSLVLVEETDGKAARWKTLGEVWWTVDDLNAFERYVRSEVTSFLAGDDAS